MTEYKLCRFNQSCIRFLSRGEDKPMDQWLPLNNVFATCLSNQMTPPRHIRTWHYKVIFVNRKGHYFIKRTN